MTQRKYFTLDVFTDVRFAGNPLAVVLDGDGLDDKRMQTIAREFNLSETVFVKPPQDPAHRAQVRIFTPARELPFAGHPTVGAAVLLALVDGIAGDTVLVLEELVGPMVCRVRTGSPDSGHAEFDLPRLPAREDGAAGRAVMAQAIGLAPGDLELNGWPAEIWSAGNPFVCVPLSDLDAMRRCRVDLATFEGAFRAGGRAAAFLFTRETESPACQFHARMFAPAFGMLEDPATGSAAAAFAGYLAAHGGYADGEHVIRVEQGYEMGRPSVMDIRMRLAGGKLKAASIGGNAVVVAEGTVRADGN